MISNLLTTLGWRPGAVSKRSGQGAGQKTVFIIEDNPDTLRAMRLALADETIRIETADTAEAAIRKLASFHPDLILLDPQVPAADGTRLAHRLLADQGLAPIPIVALSETGTEPPGSPQSSGRFDGRIEKPIDARTLGGQVRAFLESPRPETSQYPDDWLIAGLATADRRRQAATVLDAIEAGLPDSQFAHGTETGLHRLAEIVGGLQNYELGGYLKQAERLSQAATSRARSDFRSAIRLCRDLIDRDFDMAPGLAELRSGYLNHRRAEMDSLEQALQNGDFAALRKAGHNLKGTGAAYGFSELTDIGRALEVAAKSDDAATVGALLDQIESYINIVRPTPEH